MPTLKLIDTVTGETLEEFDAMDAILSLRADGGMMLLIPNDDELRANGIDPEDDAPEHILTAGAVAAMLADEHGTQLIHNWAEDNIDDHREH